MLLNLSAIKNSNIKYDLFEGWQAKLELVQNNGEISMIKKTYGMDSNWNETNVHDVEKAMVIYSTWIKKHKIKLAPTLKKELYKINNNWLISITQPYLGPDCEKVLIYYYQNNYPEIMFNIINSLLNISIKLACSSINPILRCEVKPRDFCIYNNSEPVLIDLFPPVLAINNRRINVALRYDIDSCIIKREITEVLEVTGNSIGIVRNLCEHLIATLPNASKIIKKKATEIIFECNPKLSEEIRIYLDTDLSKSKIEALIKRKNQREN